ncbi:glycoside hydrolase family 2 TIM barrel-domain containing protein [Flavivirga amylovorans]|uniref:Glycoside hydrolase family 2 TIM barrel-domain containing protein n=1 Tax=Flavivirga amylovorans TaxID=870486 RepID=A0ABT8X4S8_9FLAO|nr:glycoside hydrolase family 2 TIM barrel-domain containing protein [Flavivirga amylovorans]MDO5988991.1 glycoside hydrolase family 2 TIM barrel-domain containing protein [Flavivirga amylovorans]
MFSSKIEAQNITINSGWQFSLGNKTSNNWETINLPHTWNKDDAFDDKKGYYRGIGWYKKQLFFSKTKRNLIHYLHFKGVNQETDVYVNGNHVGNHKGGYTAFNFNISKWIHYDAYNLIEVKVSNSHNKNIPPLDADFTFYGGIYRDVELVSKQQQHISLSDFASEGFYVDYYHVSEEKAGVEVKVLIDNFEHSRTSNVIRLSLSDAENNTLLTEKRSFSVNANQTSVLTIKLPEINTPKLWSPETPYLYKLHVSLLDKNGIVLDEKWQNIGFRWVSVDANKGLFLNGKPYKIIGVNRHQDYQGYGNAVPIHLQKKDIHLIKNMGANIIRFAHYPHSQDLLKLCDELGLLVWSEIPIVNKVTNSKAFYDSCLTMQEEHLKQYYNYPSVVMFGYMNEIFLRLAFDNKSTTKEKEDAKVYTYKLAKQLEDFTRKHAPNRLTVMALHFNELYNDTKIADLSMLIGWNLYFGWYHDKIYDLGTFLDDQHKRFPNRSIMVSEYGPGADIRIATTIPKKYDYSQQYQLLLHKGYYQQVAERNFVAGMTAWNFADFGSEFRGDAIPHVNQKGLVQYNREPKDIYYWYKAVLNQHESFVHIALKHQNMLHLVNETSYPISIFSNQKAGKLYINDVFFKDLEFKNGLATALVSFTEGENHIKVITNSSEDSHTIQVNLIGNLKEEKIERLGINVGSHFNFIDSENQITFIADRPYSKNLFGYLNGSPFNLSKEKHQGIPYDIRNTNLEPLYQTMLEDCTKYKIDIPNGYYKITLYFVEPQLKNDADIIYNLKTSKKAINNKSKQRIFNILLNQTLVESHFNMAEQYPEKYGIEKSAKINIKNNEGVTISLKPMEGKPLISGILIENLN